MRIFFCMQLTSQITECIMLLYVYRVYNMRYALNSTRQGDLGNKIIRIHTLVRQPNRIEIQIFLFIEYIQSLQCSRSLVPKTSQVIRFRFRAAENLLDLFVRLKQ